MNNIKELSRVRQSQETGLWIVEILSPVSGWICQGEWATEEQANQDRLNWI